MNKKGESVLIMIFEILAVFTVIFLTINIARGFARGETVIKTNIAQDIQMMVDTLIAVPGNALVEYPHDVSNYVISLDNEKAMVMKPDDPDVRRITRYFILPERYNHTLFS